MEIVQGGAELLTNSVFNDIELICTEGFKLEPEGRIFNLGRFREIILNILDLPGSVVFLVMDKHGICHGALIGIITPAVSTLDFIGTEFVWRVGPGGKGFGMKLLKRFIDWCGKNGATHIVITSGHGNGMQSRTAEMFRSLDFKPFTEHWIRKV